METSGMDGCKLEGETFAHGSEVCRDGNCQICNDGRWEHEVHVYPDPPTPSEGE